LLGRTRRSHRVRLAGAGLAVGEKGDIVPLSEGVDALLEVLPYPGLVHVGGEYPVKDKQLAALGRIDGKTRRRLDLHHGPLEALGDKLVARVGRLQGWADANG
jgi:hypothetical protein